MLAKGAEIKGYRIERLLGRGGMGEVYEATQLGLGRRVAFKVLHTRLDDSEAFRERFRREGRLQATLEHPNIVTVYEAGELDDGLFLAMRLVDGTTLKQLIVASELDAERTLRILAPVADALDVAHAEGLIHRDVKPQNILVGQGDHSFLADFGLTRGRDQSAVTRSGQIVGTIDYIAPEQVRGEPAGTASDVYAFSGVLYECLTGSVPYPRPTDAAVLYAHISDAPPSLCSLRSDLPAGLDEVLARGMAKEPDERPASASELIAAAAGEVGGAATSRPRRQGALAHGVRAVGGNTEEVPGNKPANGRGADSKTALLTPSRWGMTAPLGALGLAAIAVLAFVGGRAGGDSGGPTLTTSVSSAAVSLRAPSDWEATPRGERPTIPGLELRREVGVAPAKRDAAGVMAGMADARGSHLLPATFIGRASGGLPQPTAVKLGELEALRYRNVRVRGFDRGLTLYAAPSTAGVVTIACYSPAEADLGATCESIAQTTELLTGKPYPLATAPQTERALDSTVATLQRKRSEGRRQLARAETDAKQAAAASLLARANASANRRLGRIAVGPALAGYLDAVRSAVATSAGAYRQLAGSARAGEAGGFDQARQSAQRSEAQLEEALASLERGAVPGQAR